MIMYIIFIQDAHFSSHCIGTVLLCGIASWCQLPPFPKLSANFKRTKNQEYRRQTQCIEDKLDSTGVDAACKSADPEELLNNYNTI